MSVQTFERGSVQVTLDEAGRIDVIIATGAYGMNGPPTVIPQILEVTAFDLRRALGDALDAIQRRHGHTLAEVEAAIAASAPAVEKFEAALSPQRIAMLGTGAKEQAVSDAVDELLGEPTQPNAAATPEPMPTPNEHPGVWNLVIDDLQYSARSYSRTEGLGVLSRDGNMITVEGEKDLLGDAYDDARWQLVKLAAALGHTNIDVIVADMRARDIFGRKKYGTPLQPHNGRNALVDAYQEALDEAVYLRQALYERDGK